MANKPMWQRLTDTSSGADGRDASEKVKHCLYYAGSELSQVHKSCQVRTGTLSGNIRSNDMN